MVAIDGPAGAGKSTVTRKVAERLGYIIVDTGALYRVVALAAERASVGFDDEAGASKLAEALVAENAVQLRRSDNGAVQVMLRGQTSRCRSERRISGRARARFRPTRACAMPCWSCSVVRAGKAAWVLEGRDIGTVVFPDAEAKFYLTASAEVACAPPAPDELAARGTPPTLAEVLSEVNERDRATAPARSRRSAKPTTRCWSTAPRFRIEQVVELIVATVKTVERKLAAGA